MNTCRVTKIRRSVPGSRRGVSAVEFALIAPIMIIFLLGTIDAGQMVNVQHKVVNASREGARVAARSSTLSKAEVGMAVTEYLSHAFPSVDPTELNAALTIIVRDKNGNLLNGGAIGSTVVGDSVSVEVRLQYEPVRWLSGLGLLGARTLASTTVMRREPL